MNNAIVVNLFGAPGAGKSTGAAYIFAKLKMAGVNAELVTEFAKDKVWEESKEVFNNQAYIFGKQSFKMSRCRNKVDVIITDSPLPLSVLYNKDSTLTDNFNNTVLDVFNSYYNLTYFLTRVKPYNPKGRFQTEEESDALSSELKEMLAKYSIAYELRDGNEQGYDMIVEDVKKQLEAFNMIKENYAQI